MAIKAIIFDCWNTLFYDEIKKHPFEEFAQELGSSFHNPKFARIFEQNFMTDNFSDFEIPTEHFLSDFGIQPKKDVKEKLEHILEKITEVEKKAFPDTIGVLEKLKGDFKLILLTNTTSKGFKSLKKKFDIDKYFDLVIKSCDTGILKPNYDIFDLIMEKTGLEKGELALVGDNVKTDVEAAKDFGIEAILLDRKMKYWNKKNSIQNLNELVPKLRKMQNFKR